MTGVCDSCDCVAEVFALPGREDRNCSQCDADLATLILLYGEMNDAERDGTDIAELEAEITPVMLRYLERCGLAHVDLEDDL